MSKLVFNYKENKIVNTIRQNVAITALIIGIFKIFLCTRILNIVEHGKNLVVKF